MRRNLVFGFTALLIFLMCNSALCAVVCYVDAASSTRTRNGVSWATAFKSINEAQTSLKRGGQIWVKSGVYRERLTLKTYIYLYGGFRGDEKSLNQRSPGQYPTVIDAGRTGKVITVNSGAWVTIDGVVVLHGYGDIGGGIYCSINSRVNIYNCSIVDCEARQMAGGVYYGKYTQGTMSNCFVMRNKAPNGAGAVIEYHSYPMFKYNVIARNTASISGGGVYCPFHSGAYLDHCTLAYNSAKVSGGGVYSWYGGPVTLVACIVAFNSAPVGGGLHGGAPTCQASYKYCDLFGNAGGNLTGSIKPAPSYAGNFSADPSFINPGSDDYRLNFDSPCSDIGAFPL